MEKFMNIVRCKVKPSSRDEYLKKINQDDRKKLRKLGVKFGRYHVFLFKLFKPSSVSLRILLWKIYNNKFTYGSFNNFKKISNDTIEVWSKILSGNDSQIILKNSFLDGNDIKFNLLKKKSKNHILVSK